MATNCVFNQCGVQRISSYDGVGLFKVTKRAGEDFEKWREKMIEIINRYRADLSKHDLRKRVMEGKVCICERHFKQDEIEYTGTLFLNSKYNT